MADGVVDGVVGERWCLGVDEECEYEWLVLCMLAIEEFTEGVAEHTT